MPPDLSSEQLAVYDEACAFVTAPSVRGRPYFVFDGQAGTGKTEVLARLARRFPDAIVCAFAGKSASVLRTRTGLNVTTIHSAIKDFSGIEEDEDGRPTPIFRDKDVNFSGKLVLLDEHGTVGTRLGDDLMATGARVVACGDPYQLRPVRDSRFFDDADLELKEIHRQAWDSPIIRQAHAVKNGRDYEEDGDEFRVTTKGELTKADLSFGGIALCWRNLTRQRLNVSRRRAKGFGGASLDVGEPVMVLKNDHRLGVFNGEIYTVATKRPPGEDLQMFDARGRTVVLRCVTCEGIDEGFDQRRYESDWTPVCLSYATTVHKFIGSEEDDVLVIDEYSGGERESWVYTALTRAKRRVLVVRT